MPIAVSEYERLAGEMLRLYEEAEIDMLKRVSSRLARGVTSPGWTEEKYAEIKDVKKELAARVDDLRNGRINLSEAAINDAYNGSSEAFLTDAQKFTNFLGITHISPNAQKVASILAELSSSLDAADRTILRKANDAYASIVGRVSASVAAGTITVREAVEREVKAFAEKGITSFVDKAGRSWEMTTYAEMATLTAIERATVEGYCDTMQAYGFDLAIISSHVGACPICEAWQDVIVSVSGNNKDYNSLADAESAGCFHPRCLHHISTYYEGISKKGRKAPRRIQAPSAAYTVRSRQRGLERNIRKWKREMAAATDPQAERNAYAHVRAAQARLRSLIGDYNDSTSESVDWLPRKYWREGGPQKLSAEARRLKPVQIPQSYSSVTVVPEPQPLTSFKDVKDFNDLEQLLERYGVGFKAEKLKQLDFEATRQFFEGVQTTLDDFGVTVYPTYCAVVTEKFAAAMSQYTIELSTKSFKDTYINIKGEKSPVVNNPMSNSINVAGSWRRKDLGGLYLGHHETAHYLEWLLDVKYNGGDIRSVHDIVNIGGEAVGDWNDHAAARKIVNEAFKELKKTYPEYKDAKTRDVINGISKYATTNRAECLAEAVSDVYMNKENAKPLSKIIYAKLQEELSGTRGALPFEINQDRRNDDRYTSQSTREAYMQRFNELKDKLYAVSGPDAAEKRLAEIQKEYGISEQMTFFGKQLDVMMDGSLSEDEKAKRLEELYRLEEEYNRRASSVYEDAMRDRGEFEKKLEEFFNPDMHFDKFDKQPPYEEIVEQINKERMNEQIMWTANGVGNYDPSHGDFTNNCMRCARSFEMAMRGYDVVALPNLGMEATGSFVGAETINIADSGISGERASIRIHHLVSQWENGARGFIEFGRAGGGQGHIYNVMKQNNDIIIVDSQTGISYKALDYAKGVYGEVPISEKNNGLADHCSYVNLIRVDKAKIGYRILEACKNRKNKR